MTVLNINELDLLFRLANRAERYGKKLTMEFNRPNVTLSAGGYVLVLQDLSGGEILEAYVSFSAWFASQTGELR